jgi:hypothetical protein
VEILSDEGAGGQRTVTLQLRSPRGGDRIDLLVPRADLASMAVAGQALPVAGGDAETAYYHLWCYGRACDGLAVRLELTGADPVAAYLVDYTAGLPAGGARLLEARPATAVSYQEGDLTIVWRRVEL